MKEPSYRSLISRLEEVDPRKLKREEKLAFWINVHNALVMHVMVHTSKLLNLQCWFSILWMVMIKLQLISFFFFLIGIFGLWHSTKQCKEGIFTVEGKEVSSVLLGVKTEWIVVYLVFCTMQAAYNIGGHTISADTIQSSILGCRMSRPGQVGSKSHNFI